MESIDALLAKLVGYGLQTNLIETADVQYVYNALLALFHMDAPEGGVMPACEAPVGVEALEGILTGLLDRAAARGLLPDDTVTYRDLFDTALMATMVPRPSEVQRRFYAEYARSPKAATDYFYKLSCDSNYIRRYRIVRDLKWKTETPDGEIDITVNLSKPEKDPKAIAAAKLQKQSGYPKCLLCRENEGYAGRVNHPARQNHRIIPLKLDGEDWYLQYSPYVYYNEHCIVFSGSHSPMKIHEKTFRLLFDFVRQFPHYILGSNADLPIVGGSILTHEHFQGGGYRFALNRAAVERTVKIAGYEGISCGVVKWPMSVIRLTGKDPDEMTRLATHILDSWRAYSDPSAFIFAETNGEGHNTITPIASKVGEEYVLDLVLRNNITTEEHPLGVYHPHAKLHHIKKENIGLIEVMGLAVLPARLKAELQQLREAILKGSDIAALPDIAKHAEWVAEFLPRYEKVDESNIDKILQDEVGKVFAEVLTDAGVYKRTPEGQEAFDRFLAVL
jgi:UDPglucose--hexose-1-phosphate uridylyltransferase